MWVSLYVKNCVVPDTFFPVPDTMRDRPGQQMSVGTCPGVRHSFRFTPASGARHFFSGARHFFPVPDIGAVAGQV
jgi:hypothetical protein